MKVHFVVNMVLFKENRILVFRKKKTDSWFIPGGHIEKDETPEQAVIRELKEELNVEGEFIDTQQLFNFGDSAYASHNILATFTHIVDGDSSLAEKHINFAFVYMLDIEGEIQPLEGQEVRFIDVNNIKEEINLPGKAIIQKAIKTRLETQE